MVNILNLYNIYKVDDIKKIQDYIKFNDNKQIFIIYRIRSTLKPKRFISYMKRIFRIKLDIKLIGYENLGYYTEKDEYYKIGIAISLSDKIALSYLLSNKTDNYIYKGKIQSIDKIQDIIINFKGIPYE